MTKQILLSFSLLIVFLANAQKYTSANVFAHNDYVQTNPFHGAYDLKVGYIEADVFLVDNELQVAHTFKEIEKDKTLASLYLEPLRKKIKNNKGSAYVDRNQSLMLMIDLKTEGVSTLKKLVDQLSNYSELKSCKTLDIVISGSVPDPGTWSEYPEYIHFDGRPNIAYSVEQLKRISMISTSFTAYSKWNGINPLSETDKEKIIQLKEEVHLKKKKLRFWATPDNTYAWKTMIELKLDMLVTDDVKGLVAFLEHYK